MLRSNYQLPHSNGISTAVRSKLRLTEFVKVAVDRIFTQGMRLGRLGPQAFVLRPF